MVELGLHIKLHGHSATLPVQEAGRALSLKLINQGMGWGGEDRVRGAKRTGEDERKRVGGREDFRPFLKADSSFWNL